MAMVDVLDNQEFHNPVDLPQIDHHPGCFINGSADRYLELVVVAVVSRACPEHLAVAGLVPLRPGKNVSSREGQPSRHVNSLQLIHTYMRKSTVTRITSRLLPQLLPAGSGTASMMSLGCQPNTWLRFRAVNGRRPPTATLSQPSGSARQCSGRWCMSPT